MTAITFLFYGENEIHCFRGRMLRMTDIRLNKKRGCKSPTLPAL